MLAGDLSSETLRIDMHFHKDCFLQRYFLYFSCLLSVHPSQDGVRKYDKNLMAQDKDGEVTYQ